MYQIKSNAISLIKKKRQSNFEILQLDSTPLLENTVFNLERNRFNKKITEERI